MTAPAAPRTAGEMLGLARDWLARRELPESRLEAELLVAHALGLDRLHLFLQLDRPVSAAEIDAARELLVRRAGREPVAYLTGAREFYGRRFAVGAGVLVPRPETELVVDVARERAREWREAGREALAVADLGTGSGCLAVTLALELPGARVAASDVSAEALAYARRNAQRLGAEVRFAEGDGLPALETVLEGPLDLLVSNPPYVAPEERAALAPEVRDHEPELALFTPPGDAEHWIRALLDGGPRLLRPGGALLIEIGIGQGPLAEQLARERGLDARLHPDLAGVPRVLEVVAPS